jgi:hypothetical protein
LGGAAAGLLAEAELDTRRINAEKIYEEMVRRRLEREKREGRGSGNASSNSNEPKTRKKNNKGLSGKERKRIDALSEVVDVMVADSAPVVAAAAAADEPAAAVQTDEALPKKQDGSGGGGVGVGGSGVLDTIKGFYERADNMAASQALLLNKKLEDAGVLEKITDETGLNVIGKEKAAAMAAMAAAAASSSKNTSSDDDKKSDSQVEASTEKP